MVSKIKVYEELAGNAPTVAQATALAGHDYASLKQDTTTGLVYDKDGLVIFSAYRGVFSGKPISPANGDIAYFTDACFPAGGARFRYVSSLGFWVPDGVQTIFVNSGTLTTPISTVSGVTAGTFALTNNTLPAGLLNPGMRGTVKAFCRRTGATATAAFAMYIGTAGSTADSIFASISLPATTALGCRFDVSFYVASSGMLFMYGNTPVNSTSSSATIADRTTNINTAAAMSFTCGISSANVADSFALNQVFVELAY